MVVARMVGSGFIARIEPCVTPASSSLLDALSGRLNAFDGRQIQGVTLRSTGAPSAFYFPEKPLIAWTQAEGEKPKTKYDLNSVTNKGLGFVYKTEGGRVRGCAETGTWRVLGLKERPGRKEMYYLRHEVAVQFLEKRVEIVGNVALDPGVSPCFQTALTFAVELRWWEEQRLALVAAKVCRAEAAIIAEAEEARVHELETTAFFESLETRMWTAH
jgi:predicted DNA-binding protein